MVFPVAFMHKLILVTTGEHTVSEMLHLVMIRCVEVNQVVAIYLIFKTKDNTYCHGYRSCFGSTFERTNSTNSYAEIVFYGDESGGFTTLNLKQNTIIAADGRLSLYKSIISMYKSSSLDVEGIASLNGAKLYCDDGCYNVSSLSGNGIYDVNILFKETDDPLYQECATQDLESIFTKSYR